MENLSIQTCKAALYYVPVPETETAGERDTVQCLLCPHRCRISSGKTGLCGVRKNIDGTLCAMNYNRIASLSLDPIEKKPLYHFHPGSRILSVGTAGCNLKCPFCQNHSISRCTIDQTDTIEMTGETLVERALELIPEGNIGIAYTYNEPTVWYEYVLDTAKTAKANGLYNVLVTNGYICQEPLERLLPYVDAMNVDLKSFDRDFYRKTLKGGLEEVLAAITASAAKCHVEVTTLVIPDVNDSVREIEQIASFLAGISPEIPLHLTRFFPRFEWRDRSPTPVDTLYRLAETAKKQLRHVHIGNV